MCNNCIHQPVCGKFLATGGHVRECEHYREDRHGRWHEVDGETEWECHYRCSKCFTRSYELTNYCPNCGADMRSMEGEDVQA